MQAMLNLYVYGNTLYSYFLALVVFICGAVAVHVFKKHCVSRLKGHAAMTETTLDDGLIAAIEKALVPALYFGVFYIALRSLTLSADFKHGLKLAAIALFTLLAARTLVLAADLGLQAYLKTSETAGGERPLKGINGLVKFAIWTLALVFLLDNLGVKISAVVAGLGIGGIAVALAAQAVLADLFSYFVIFFDKPFEVGDFVIVGDKMGAIEHIGIKTTRIRALGGEQLVLSNTDLTNSRVHNFKKMERRRVVFKLGVTYQTSLDQLKAIPGIVEQVIAEQEDAVFDRGHFAAYGDFSLDFEFVYYVSGADYNQYMDIQQAINLAIFAAFEREAIEFAYPTQTLLINRASR